MSSPEKVSRYIETMFKLKGTNYSQVASKLKSKSGKPMSRQTLFRMVKNETITFSTVLEIANKLGVRPDFDSLLNLDDVVGPRVRKRVNGVRYDTDKMFSVGVEEQDGEVKKETCWDPISDNYVVVHHFGDEKRKYPYLEIKDYPF